MSELFPLGKENYCRTCYIDNDQAVLKTECPHAAPPAAAATEKPTAKSIIADERELFVNTPIGFPYARRAHQRDLGGLKSLLIEVLVGADDQPGGWGDAIRAATQEELIDTCLNNNFTFDPEFYGVREIPLRPDGNPISRLDDPEYRRAKGMSW